MADVKTIEKMYSSLWRGEKEYKFSQLRAALKEHDVTDLDSLKLNLKDDRKALLKIAEKFLMDICNAQSEREAKETVPEIPFTYAWQFEGVDDSENCFIYPMSPLTCDVLNRQSCELVPMAYARSKPAIDMIDMLSDEEAYSLAVIAGLVKDSAFSVVTLERLGNEIEDFISSRKNQDKNAFGITWEIVASIMGNNIDSSRLRAVLACPEEFAVAKPKPEHPLSQFFKTSDLLEVGVMRRIFDSLRQYQVFKGISGLKRKEFDCRGKKLSYWQESAYMNLLPSDAPVLESQVMEMVDYFLYLAKMDSPKYSLSRIDYDVPDCGDGGEDVPTTYSQILEYAKSARFAWLHQESLKWEPVKIASNTGEVHQGYRGTYIDCHDEPDTVELHLTLAWENFEKSRSSESVGFRLRHPGRKPEFQVEG